MLHSFLLKTVSRLPYSSMKKQWNPIHNTPVPKAPSVYYLSSLTNFTETLHSTCYYLTYIYFLWNVSSMRVRTLCLHQSPARIRHSLNIIYTIYFYCLHQYVNWWIYFRPPNSYLHYIMWLQIYISVSVLFSFKSTFYTIIFPKLRLNYVVLSLQQW